MTHEITKKQAERIIRITNEGPNNVFCDAEPNVSLFMF